MARLSAPSLRRAQEKEAASSLATCQLTQQQRAEDEACALRVKNGRADHHAQRALDFERLLKRYQNVLSELESQHRAEQVRLDRTERLQAIRFGMSASKPAGQPRRATVPPPAGRAAIEVTSRITVQPSAVLS
jgi:hypothetical protein